MANAGALLSARVQHEVVGDGWEYAEAKYEWTTAWCKGMFSNVIACANCGNCALNVQRDLVGDDRTKCYISDLSRTIFDMAAVAASSCRSGTARVLRFPVAERASRVLQVSGAVAAVRRMQRREEDR